MPSRIDEAGYTKAFDYPVASKEVHWWGGSRVGVGGGGHVTGVHGPFPLINSHTSVCVWL